jgi:hypothetical protein
MYPSITLPIGFETCVGRDDVFHVTVTFEPELQTVPACGLVIGGAQTSLPTRCILLRTTGAADADMPRTKEKRSAAGDGRIIKFKKSASNGLCA